MIVGLAGDEIGLWDWVDTGLEILGLAEYGELAAIEPGWAERDIVPPSNKGLATDFVISCAEPATFTGAGVGNPGLTSWPIGRYVRPPTTTGGKPRSSPDSIVSRSSPCDSEACFA